MHSTNLPESEPGLHGSRQPCSLWRRLLIMLYDAVAIIALLMMATAVLMLAGLRELNIIQDPLYALYLLAVWFGYLGWCWHRGGMTLGMRAWRVRIQDADGDLPGWGTCLARFMLSLVSAVVLGAGFLWSLIDAQKRCWHDGLSGTLLIRTQARPDRA